MGVIMVDALFIQQFGKLAAAFFIMGACNKSDLGNVIGSII